MRTPSSLFRATSDADGQAYALRRLEGPPLPPEAILRGQTWKQLRHPNIVNLVELFNSDAEGQRLTYIVQDFLPGALTLEQAYLQQRVPVTEESLWPIALQCLAAFHAVHSTGMAIRGLDLSNVLLTNRDTIHLSAAGFLDLVQPEAAHRTSALQRDDLAYLGRLLVNLACTSPTAASQHALQKSMGYIQATFSGDFSQLLMLLFGGRATVHDATAMVSGRLMSRMSQVQLYGDALMQELSKECENGRLLRLLVKLCHVADRQQLGMDAQWGESSDRQLLRMFRDSLFQQNDERGGAVVDYAYVVHALNRLDAGHAGTSILSFPGGNDASLFVASYHDMKTVLERSFDEIASSRNYPDM